MPRAAPFPARHSCKPLDRQRAGMARYCAEKRHAASLPVCGCRLGSLHAVLFWRANVSAVFVNKAPPVALGAMDLGVIAPCTDDDKFAFEVRSAATPSIALQLTSHLVTCACRPVRSGLSSPPSPAQSRRTQSQVPSPPHIATPPTSPARTQPSSLQGVCMQHSACGSSVPLTSRAHSVD